MKKIDIITAAFNESQVLGLFLCRLNDKLGKIKNIDFRLILVNDGSNDNTLGKFKKYQPENFTKKTISLSRNFGKEAAITAGIDHSDADAAIIIDTDLQDPLEVIPMLIEQWNKGYKNILARRVSRKDDSFFKRKSAECFYNLINKMSETPIPKNTGDFRLIDKIVIDDIKKLKEKNRFMKGILSWSGYSTTFVDYERTKRAAGETKWNFIKLWKLALDGIFSFSSVPLKIWSYLGIAMAIPSGIFILFIIGNKLVGGHAADGYTSIMATILFLGSVQLIGIGILGEYLSRIYNEVKNRPIYLIDQENSDL